MSANIFAVVLDGLDEVSFVSHVEGGALHEGVVASESFGGRLGQVPQLMGGNRKPIDLHLGAASSNGLLAWVQAGFWGRQVVKRTGQILYANAQGMVEWELDFFNAEPVSLTIPALAADGSEAVMFKTQLIPEWSTLRKATQSRRLTPSSPTYQKAFRKNRFHFDIDGLNLRDIVSVGEITLQKPTKEMRFSLAHGQSLIGHGSMNRVTSVGFKFPDLKVTMSADNPLMMAWHTACLEGALPDHLLERTGELAILAPDGRPLIEVFMDGLGIRSFALTAGDTKSGGMRKLDVTLYAKTMKVVPIPMSSGDSRSVVRPTAAAGASSEGSGSSGSRASAPAGGEGGGASGGGGGPSGSGSGGSGNGSGGNSGGSGGNSGGDAAASN